MVTQDEDRTTAFGGMVIIEFYHSPDAGLPIPAIVFAVGQAKKRVFVSFVPFCARVCIGITSGEAFSSIVVDWLHCFWRC